MGLAGDDLLVGPRGRVLCMAVAHRLDREVWSAWLDAAWHLGDAARSEALVRVLDSVDVQPEGGWLDPATFLEPVAEAVGHAMYWQPPHDEDVLAANPKLRAALRPLAAAIAGAPATKWWNSPADLSALRYTGWAVDGSAAPSLTGAATKLATWREKTVAENLAARINRPTNPEVLYSGTWWSTPTLVSLVSTTRPLAGVGSVELAWHEDSLGLRDALIWPLETIGPPRIWEIDQPQAWVDLVQTYPLDVTEERRDDWQRTTDRSGPWFIPDWEAVAADWDAVPVTVAGYLTTATRALPLADGDGATMLAGWNPDQTWWLNDILRSATTEPERWHNTEGASAPQLNWHHASE
jgi:hypothetical protein